MSTRTQAWLTLPLFFVAGAATATEPAASAPVTTPAPAVAPAAAPAAVAAPPPVAAPATVVAPAAAPETVTATQAPPASASDSAAPAAELTESGAEASPAPARQLLGLAIAPKLGAVVPTSDLGLTYYLGLDVSYRLPVMAQRFGVALDVGFAQPGLDGSVAAPAGAQVDYELAQRLVMINVEAFATLPVQPVEVYGGLGLGVYALRAKVVSLGDENTETQTRSGLQLRAGAELPLGPGGVFGELRYHYVKLDFLSTGEASGGGMTVAAGYRFHF